MIRIFSTNLRAAWPLLLVLGIGLAVRLVALIQLAVINPDGILYIQQAKALSTGQWHLLSESLSYVSLYPFLIAFLHYFVHDWVLSGQLVSLCFSMGMLLVVYRIARLFFTPAVSWLTTLLFALTPVFVRYSVDVMREAPFWFFFSLSLWLVLLAIRQTVSANKSSALLLASNCTILLASWSRIEAIVLLPATCLFLCVWRHDHNIRRLLIFLLPSACLVALGSGIAFVSGCDVFTLVRINEVIQKCIAPMDAYHALRGELKQLANGYGWSLLGCYLQTSYHTVWVTAMGGIVVNAMEAYFYPYVLVYALGLKAAWRRMRHVSEYQYMAIVFGCSLCVLLVHSIQSWIMTQRFVTILIIPSCVVAGLGLQNMLSYFASKKKIGETVAVILVASIIFIVSIKKNVQDVEHDKYIYVDISKHILSLNNSNNQVMIASSLSPATRWISFYVNIDKKYEKNDKFFALKYSSVVDLVHSMHSKGISLFLWDEYAWNNSEYGKKISDFNGFFREIGRWSHNDTGDIILFELLAR
jgi:4-amino-4-deoxy-L-arabinose transferase and related glycosyltransferases of PMT family